MRKEPTPIEPRQWHDWQWQWRHRIRRLDRLVSRWALEPYEGTTRGEVAAVYPMAITPYYASLVAKPSPRDPIFLQCVPDARELCGTEHEDPLGEEDHQPVDHLIQRYADRCVVMVTDTCAVHCRHCNRKRYWRRRRGGLKERDLTKICAYISQTPSLREIIISGGDPLTLSDEKVETILGNIKKISHVEVIRLGSRVPVTLPMRITPDLCRLLRHFRPLWFNTQFNHPQEITPEAATACERLVSAGIPVSNQSVLLKGINDDGETLKNLFYGLQRMGVRPYYLFQAEPVRGAGHFQVDVKKGMAIMEALRREISGLCLPRYVMDTGGVMGKLPLQGHRDCTDEGWQSRQFPLTKQDK